jgi:hypothetical protein
MTKQRREIPAEVEGPGPIGETVRARIGKEAYDLDVERQCCGGLNFGYFYEGSPIIAYDGEPHPAYTMHDFSSSTVPGCRAPHLWLGDGRSLYDALGTGYTLLRLNPTVRVSGFVEAAAQRGSRSPSSTLMGPMRGRSTRASSYSCVPTSMWPGAAMTNRPLPWTSSTSCAARAAYRRARQRDVGLLHA